MGKVGDVLWLFLLDREGDEVHITQLLPSNSFASLPRLCPTDLFGTPCDDRKTSPFEVVVWNATTFVHPCPVVEGLLCL